MNLIKKITLLVLFLGLLSGGIYAQYPSFELTDPEQPIEKFTENKMHADSMDTLISSLPYEIQVYIRDKNGDRKGASKKRDNQGNYISSLKNGVGMALDRSRMRNAKRDPFTLIIFVPSDKGSGTPKLRGITTNFNSHFNPSSVSTVIMGNRGIEFRYHFKEGLPELPAEHEHFVDDKGIKNHVSGHICIPTQEVCS
jgi:hypothetical protein